MNAKERGKGYMLMLVYRTVSHQRSREVIVDDYFCGKGYTLCLSSNQSLIVTKE